MAHAMGKLTIAEFVEDREILAKLVDLGVDYVQGYGIAQPAPLIHAPSR
jgi:EAL domain-containing protein (putative c-di-GMP-specific phosphodiesterase class I)